MTQHYKTLHNLTTFYKQIKRKDLTQLLQTHFTTLFKTVQNFTTLYKLYTTSQHLTAFYNNKIKTVQNSTKQNYGFTKLHNTLHNWQHFYIAFTQLRKHVFSTTRYNTSTEILQNFTILHKQDFIQYFFLRTFYKTLQAQVYTASHRFITLYTTLQHFAELSRSVHNCTQLRKIGQACTEVNTVHNCTQLYTTIQQNYTQLYKKKNFTSLCKHLTNCTKLCKQKQQYNSIRNSTQLHKTSQTWSQHYKTLQSSTKLFNTVHNFHKVLPTFMKL